MTLCEVLILRFLYILCSSGPWCAPATRLALAGSSFLELQQFHEFSKGDDFHTQSLHFNQTTTFALNSLLATAALQDG